MITKSDVGQELYSKVEGSIWRNVQRIKGYNWYRAGYAIHVAPSEHEMIEYGREWALALCMGGADRWQDAVEQATKAMYRYTYEDIRCSIRHTGGEKRRIEARELAYDWSETPLHGTEETGSSFDTYLTTPREPLYYQTPNYSIEEFELFIDQLPLTDRSKQILLQYSHGFKPKEIYENLGISNTTFAAHRNKAFAFMREYYGKIL